MKLKDHQVDQIKEELAANEALVTKAKLDKVIVEKDLANMKVHSPVIISAQRCSHYEVLSDDCC